MSALLLLFLFLNLYRFYFNTYDLVELCHDVVHDAFHGRLILQQTLDCCLFFLASLQQL